MPIIRYEDLLATPEEQSARILRHLGIERSADGDCGGGGKPIIRAQERSASREGETGRAKFLRVGKSGQWREKLPAHLQARFTEELGAELARWGYSA